MNGLSEDEEKEGCLWRNGEELELLFGRERVFASIQIETDPDTFR